MRLSHFIITAFNVNIYGRWPEKRHQPCMVASSPDEWTEYRLGLMTRYTAASLEIQTVKDFTWIVLYDPLTPERYMKQLRNMPNVSLVPMVGSHEVYWAKNKAEAKRNQDMLRDVVRGLLKSDTDYVVSTMLGSDDGFHKDFVKHIQQHQPTHPREAVVMPWQYYIDLRDSKIQRVYDDRNSQPTYFEKVGVGIWLVYSHIHTKVRDFMPLTLLDPRKQQPMAFLLAHRMNQTDHWHIKPSNELKSANLKPFGIASCE